MDVVFADGIGSSGKGMLSHILGSFRRIEKQSNDTEFDFVAYIHELGKISTDAAVTYLQTAADMALYHQAIGRDLNFRPKDSTSVWSNARPINYLVRLFRPDGDPAVTRIRQGNPVLNEAPHDALRNASLFFEAFGQGLKIVYIVRHPHEIALDWLRRGFGTRIGSDPREFQFTVNLADRVIPWFLAGRLDLDHKTLNAAERALLMVEHCIISNWTGYEALEAKWQPSIRFVSFDTLCRTPNQVVELIADFLGTHTTKSTARVIRRESLPRDRPTLRSFEAELSGRVRPELRDSLARTHDVYRQFAKLAGIAT